MNARDEEEIFASKGGTKIPFGKYAGLCWGDTPLNYRLYMGTQGIGHRNPELYAELLHSILKGVAAELPAADDAAFSAAVARLELEAEGLC